MSLRTRAAAIQSPRMGASSHWRSILLVLIALALIGSLGVALYRSTSRADEAHQSVEHAEDVLEALARIREQLSLVESNQRGFLLTENHQFLRDRDAAIAAFGNAMDELGVLVVSDANQRARFDRMTAEVETRLALVHRTIERFEQTGIDSARALFDTGAPQEANARVRAIANEMQTHETRLLAERRKDEARRHATTRVFLAIAGIAGLILLVPAGAIFFSQYRAREEAERRLLAISGGLPGTIFQLRVQADGGAHWTYLPSESEWPQGSAPVGALVDASEALGQVVEDDRKRLDQLAIESMLASRGFEFDFRVHRSDGALRWIRSTAVMTERSGHAAVWTGYWSDITDGKHAEQALIDATERLQSAQHVARLGDWSYDLKTGSVAWSPTVYTLLARDPALGPPRFEESLGFFQGDGASTITDAFDRAVETGETQRFELQINLKKDDLRHLDVIAMPVRGIDGEVTGLNGTIQDVTERHQLARRLLEAKDLADAGNRAKSIFLATMSHEIRTPMYGMVGLLELLALTPLSADQRATLDIVRDSGRALQRIIDDVLDFSKIEAGKLEVVPEATSIARVIEGVHRIYSGSASGLGLMLVCRCDPAISRALWVDGLRLRQILGNFVSNALKFTERGRVEIRAELIESLEDSQRVRFAVQDTGVGLTDDQQRRIFEPFVQVGAQSSGRAGGTGLGLAICARLAEQMQGSLHLQSQPGEGTTISLELVMKVMNADALAAETLESTANDLPELFRFDRTAPELGDAESQGTLVLVVDDHPINRLVLQSQLGQLGYAAKSAEHGAQALELFRTHRFGMVITDCNMPEMTGYDLARCIREFEVSSGGPRTPVLACTANVLGGEMQQCFDAGMDDYISKPASLAQLFDKLNRWLPAHHQAYEAIAESSATTGAEPRSAMAAPINRLTLHHLAGGIDTDIATVMAQFKQVNDVDAQHLRDAVQRNDTAAVVRFSHRMRGAGKLIGADSLGEALAKVEAAGRRGDVAGVVQAMGLVERELTRIDDFLAVTES